MNRALHKNLLKRKFTHFIMDLMILKAFSLWRTNREVFSNTIHVLACGKAPSEYKILSEIIKDGEQALLKAVHIFS